jgi:DNA-binding beta-propeller fold protein YncE
VTHPSARRVLAAASLSLAAAVTVFASAAAGAAPSPSAIHLHRIVVGGSPDAVAIDGKTGAVWVAAGKLVRISEATQRVTAKITVTPGVRLVAVDAKTGSVWAAACLSTCSIVEVSEATNRVMHRVPGPKNVSGLAVDPRTGLVWVAGYDSLNRPELLAITETSHRVAHTIRLHFSIHHMPGPLAVSSKTGTVWVSVIPGDPSTSLSWASEYSESTRRLIHVYSGENTTSVITAFDSARGTAWLAFGLFRESSGMLDEVNIARHRITRTFLAAPLAPDGLAIDSRTRTVIATSGAAGSTIDSVALIAESSGKLLRRIPMGPWPFMLAFDPATGNVYVPVVFKGVVTQFHL